MRSSPTSYRLDDAQCPISTRMVELRDKGYRVFQMQAWEHTRPEIYYAEK